MVIDQPSLFDTAAPMVPVPRQQVRSNQFDGADAVFRRTAARRPCRACGEYTGREIKALAPMIGYRQPAAVEVTVTDDDSLTVLEGFYCRAHAERLGWDPSVKRTQHHDTGPVLDRVAATELAELIEVASRGRLTDAWCTSVSRALERRGARGLDMPLWSTTSSGRLVGHLSGRARRAIMAWADAFGADIEEEQWPGEHRLTVDCLVVIEPEVRVLITGHVDPSGLDL